MVIIGFGSTAQVGKDTSCDYLMSKLPKGIAIKVSFADKVKETAINLFGLSHEQCYGPKDIKEAPDGRFPKPDGSGFYSPRELMQGVGDKLRDIIPTIWIDAVFNITIPNLERQGYSVFLISDVRYPNEALRIQEEGGFLIKINRKDGGALTGKEHRSETALNEFKDYDFVINNEGSFKDLFSTLDIVSDEIFGEMYGV